MLRSIGMAIAVAIALALGVTAGGLAYAVGHPAYARLVWIERSADASDSGVVRRALFSDGRFLALSDHGYRAGLLDATLTAEVFSTVSASGSDWHATYTARAALGELVDLKFDGTGSRTIRIANPDTNLTVPPALTRIMLILAAADRQVATVPFRSAGLRFWATKATDTHGASVDALPIAFPLTAARLPAGVVVSGVDLATARQIWPDLDDRLLPGQNELYVRVDGQLWRLAWTLDIDSVGALGTAPAVTTP